MHKYYIDMLECPLCHSDLKWEIKEETEKRVINANVTCLSCNEEYEVRDEIAIFLTSKFKRNDLWENVESELEKYLKENPDIVAKLFNTPEEDLNGADYWFKASVLEMQKDYETSSKMFNYAFEKIYTSDYISGWENQMDYIVEHVKDINKPIIDIASGKGYLVERLLSHSRNFVVATDFSPTILQRNKEYYKYKGLYDRLSLVAFDARKTPFKENSIDIMTTNLGLQNIENPDDIIKEMYRITKNEFMSVFHFVDEKDKVHLNLLNEYGIASFSTKKKAIEIFEKPGWNVTIANSFEAKVKPTPVGSILEGASIDGLPIEDTTFDFSVIIAKKQSN